MAYNEGAPDDNRQRNAILPAGGEMKRLTYARDWSQTPLGPANRWPQSLKSAVEIMLNSRYPMLVWWGPRLIQIYNDAYTPVLGMRHPSGLGQPAAECWSEAWPEDRGTAKARRLHGKGYDTCFIGKWHMGVDDSSRPGFNRWVSFQGQGECVNPVLNVNGTSTRAKDYITDLLTEHALAFLDQARSQPFCLYLAHKAIHPNITQHADGSTTSPNGGGAEDFIPAERHRSLYAGKTPPRWRSYAHAPLGKPALRQDIPGPSRLDVKR